MPKKPTYRLNMDFTQEVKDRLEAVQDLSGAASKTEVLRRALSLFDFILTHQADGGKVLLVNADGETKALDLTQ